MSTNCFNVGDRVVSTTIIPFGGIDGKIMAIHNTAAWVLFDGEEVPRSISTSLLQKAPLKNGDAVRLSSVISPGWRGTVLAVEGKYAWVRPSGNDQPQTYKLDQLVRV